MTLKTRLSLRRRSTRFAADERGATAVEFGFIAAPFLALTFAIMETGLFFWNQQVLETALSSAARQIYTGSFQQDAANASRTNAQLAAEFKTRLCAEVRGMFDCASLVTVDIRPASSFPSTGVSVPITTNPTTGAKTFDTTGWGYSQAQQNQIVVVRAAMEYPTLVTLLNANQSNLTNGKRLIMASTAFKTEPFGNAPIPAS